MPWQCIVDWQRGVPKQSWRWSGGCQTGFRLQRSCFREKNKCETWLVYCIVIGLRHDVSNLSPSEPVLQSQLVRWRPHYWSFNCVACGGHVAKHRTSNCSFLFSAPFSTKAKYTFMCNAYVGASKTYLHITKHTRVSPIIIMAATLAPMATPRTSPSSSHWFP